MIFFSELNFVFPPHLMNIVAAGKLEDILPSTARWPMIMSNIADERFLYSTRETKVPYELKRQMQISNLPYFAKNLQDCSLQYYLYRFRYLVWNRQGFFE